VLSELGECTEKSLLSHKVHRVALISTLWALSQTPAYTMTPWIRV